MDSLTIGQLAERAQVGVETIRFYEREGLLEAPPRTPSGYRSYPLAALERLNFIRTAKDLGFSLKEISELLALRVDPTRTCGEVQAIAEEKIADVEARIRALERIRASLRDLVSACENNETTGECPILENLGKESKS